MQNSNGVYVHNWACYGVLAGGGHTGQCSVLTPGSVSAPAGKAHAHWPETGEQRRLLCKWPTRAQSPAPPTDPWALLGSHEGWGGSTCPVLWVTSPVPISVIIHTKVEYGTAGRAFISLAHGPPGRVPPRVWSLPAHRARRKSWTLLAVTPKETKCIM